MRVASPRLCDLGRTISDLGRTIGRLRGFSASFPRTGHELDSHSKKIRCSRAAPTLDHTLAALLKANPTSLAASNTVPRVSRPTTPCSLWSCRKYAAERATEGVPSEVMECET